MSVVVYNLKKTECRHLVFIKRSSSISIQACLSSYTNIDYRHVTAYKHPCSVSDECYSIC